MSRHNAALFSFLLCLVSATLITAGCGGGSPAQGAAAAPPPTGVEIRTLEAHPIEQASEFIATMRSLRSTTVQPEVEGLVTRIFVKSGDRVRQGDPLVQINAERQAATVHSTDANRGGAEADVEFWRQQVKRLEALVEAGAISTQEFEQAQNSLRTAEARLASLDAQLKEGRVQLQFFRVVAPQSGVVGDIPIRAGDRITTSTVVTTIDQNDDLEIYIQVPLDRTPELRVGLPVQLLDRDGKVVATNPITFIAPRVDEGTQTVLVKVAMRGELSSSIRLQQFVRARIIWASTPEITVPITAVNRISGQYFAFVAEQTEQGGLVARQKPIEVGEIVGNDYVVRSGLQAGDRLIVSGIQKLGDGAPVQAQ